MIAYRVDDRDFQINSIITPRNESFIRKTDFNESIKLKVEEILELYRPLEKPKRDKILMLFKNLERAKRHWSLYSNSKIYQVEIDSRNINHIGDYQKVETLYNLIKNDNSNDLESFAKTYWSELNVVEPELFINEALVTKILGNNNDRQKFLKARLGISPMERDTE